MTNVSKASVRAEVHNAITALGTNSIVKVIAVHPGGGIVGTVDVQPMVHQQTSDGVAVPHGTIYGVPYLRIQGGTCAVIVDPVAGDIGYIIISGRDQSNVVATRAPALPGSFRQHSMADCVYVGGFLNEAPTYYLQVTGGAINMVAPMAQASENLQVTNGATGTFTTNTGLTITVRSGIVTNIG